MMAKSGGELDVTQLFDLLESNNPEVIQEIREMITDNFNNTKENWLVAGLFEYYLQSGSMRCAELLCGISREPHDKFLIDKMFEGIRSPSKDIRKQTLTFLGHVVSKQPSWLYKITQHSLFREILRLLKTETDVVVLMTGLLTVIMIIPTIPFSITAYINDIFDVFGRLATWAHTSAHIPREHLLHLQVGLYSLFHRLYAMYPCNFLSYLRHNFSSVEKRVVFFHTIMPMLEKVKMHPALVTATKEGEMNPARWRSKEYHEVIAECSKISLDVYESSFPEEITSTFSRLNTSESERDSGAANLGDLDAILKLPPSSLICQAMKTSDLTSLVSYIDDSANTAPPTPLSTTSVGTGYGGVPTPIMNKTTPQPETALEATPENTPVKDRDRLYFKLPPTSPAAMQLNFGGKSGPHTPPVMTPGNSVPSSPLPVTTEFPTSSGHVLARRDSIFDTTATTIPMRRDSIMFQRLQKVQMEQQQQQQAQSQIESSTPAVSATTTANVTTAPVARPESHRKASAPAPITIIQPSGQFDEASSTSSDFLSDRDRPTGGPLTPMLPTPISQGQGLIDPDLSLITLDEDSSVDECHSKGCQKGGLHMADHRQMMAFAKRVSRLRFHSQCGPGPSTSELNASLAPSPGTSPSSTSSSSGLQHFKSRIIKRSFSCPNIKKPISEEDEIHISHDSQDGSAGETLTEESSSNPAAGTADGATQELEHPYEHLFQKILPTVLSPPVESRTLPSPHYLLDLCLKNAASLHNSNNGRHRSEELAMMKGQVELLHGQLLFERHRREAHALRNRRLAGKCRKMQNMEEQNNTMRREIHNLETELTVLKKEVTTQRTMGLNKEKELQAVISDLENKLDDYRKQVSDLKDDNSQLDSKCIRLQENFTALQKESDQKKADLFSLENEIKHLQRYLGLNSELRLAYDVSQKEILLLGELLRRHQEAVGPPIETQRFLKEEMEDLRQTCEEEIRSLRNMLEGKMSQCEVACGMINDLDKKLEKREAIIMEQNKRLQDTVMEHQTQLELSEKKYEAVKETNHRLELEILNLQHQLTIKNYNSRPVRGRMASSPSNGEMSPTGNSNHSDVDSAASASGYQLSPDRNTCFFGSPQFDPDEMKDLQLVLDQESASTSAAGTRRNSTQDPQSPVSGQIGHGQSSSSGYSNRGFK